MTGTALAARQASTDGRNRTALNPAKATQANTPIQNPSCRHLPSLIQRRESAAALPPPAPLSPLCTLTFYLGLSSGRKYVFPGFLCRGSTSLGKSREIGGKLGRCGEMWGNLGRLGHIAQTPRRGKVFIPSSPTKILARALSSSAFAPPVSPLPASSAFPHPPAC